MQHEFISEIYITSRLFNLQIKIYATKISKSFRIVGAIHTPSDGNVFFVILNF